MVGRIALFLAVSPQEHVRQAQDAPNCNQEHDGVVAGRLAGVLSDVEHVPLFLWLLPPSHFRFHDFLVSNACARIAEGEGCGSKGEKKTRGGGRALAFDASGYIPESCGGLSWRFVTLHPATRASRERVKRLL